MCNDNDHGSIFVGFLIGALLGAGLAAFTTPYRGTEALAQLDRGYQRGRQQMRRLQTDGELAATELSWRSRSTLRRFLENLRERITTLTYKLDELSNRGVGVLIEDEIL